jgi:CHASE2 domain-containing sensor protein
MNIERLMERLRVQSLIQRLRRQHGDAIAWDIVREAFEIELRVPESNRKQKKAVSQETAK